MAWTLTTIRTLARQLSGLRSTGQKSDDDMDLAINQFYQNVFPVTSKLADFEDFYEFDTVDGTQSYAMPDTVLSVDEPITIDDIDGDAVQFLDYSRDKSNFFTSFIEDASATEQQPTTILVWRRYFYLGPIPDTVYTVKMPSLQKPTALSDSNTTPLRDAWGPAIAYGTAIQLLIDAKDHDGAMSISETFAKHMADCENPDLSQAVGMRATPRF